MRSNLSCLTAAVLLVVLPGNTGSMAASDQQNVTTARYVVDLTWPQKPDHIKWGQMPGVTVDTQDRIYVFNRSAPAVQVYQADGTFLRAWNIEDAGGAHGIRIGPDQSVWTTDIKNHVVRRYDPEGRLLLTLGELGQSGL